MSIAYLDPGNIESDLRSGSVAKFKVGTKITGTKGRPYNLVSKFLETIGFYSLYPNNRFLITSIANSMYSCLEKYLRIFVRFTTFKKSFILKFPKEI